MTLIIQKKLRLTLLLAATIHAASVVFVLFAAAVVRAQDANLTWHTARQETATTPIAAVVPDLNHLQKWDTMNGDTADPFWADDGNLYQFTCDGRGFGKESRNLCFNKLMGQDLAQLKGSLINSMDEYGKANATGPDHATWKVTGQECIDGVFYTFVVRNIYGDKSKDPLLRQTSFNASLIKSTDRGLIWSRSAQENYDAPMWPGARFGAPCFIHYGQNGGKVAQDQADQYVYALSNNGFWNGGDDFILGRVRRADLPKLNAADWSYYVSGDGRADNSWTNELAQAKPILTRPAKLGWTSPCYIPALNRYLLVSWYITPTLKKWFEPKLMTYDFFEAEHPWGPWKFVSSFNDQFLVGGHMYGPNLCAKYQEQRGDEVKIDLYTSGCPFQDKPDGLYKMWRIPLTLKTKSPRPTALVNDDDPAIRYFGTWQAATKRGFHYQHDDIRFSKMPGDALEFSFTGTGVQWLSEKFIDEGRADVFLDGQSEGSVELKQGNFPRMVQIPVFSAQGLTNGPHKLRIVNSTTNYVVVDAFAVADGAVVKPPPALPTPSQLRWHELEFYGFLHFTVNNFTGRQWGQGDEPESVFNPTDFDADQIVRAFKDAGMKGIILTAKHHDGFCLWPSKFTEHSVKNSPWQNGHGDVVKEISEACRRQGLKFGIYLSPWDRHDANFGRPAYVTYFNNQLRELLTNYGPIFEVWFDGALGADGKSGQGWYGGANEIRRIDPATYYRWPEVFRLIRELQPDAHIQGDIGPDGRWGGNENGEAGDPCWDTVRSRELVFPALNFDLDLHGHRDGNAWMPAEMPCSIRCPIWFWQAGDDQKVLSPEKLFQKYLTSVGRGAALLLNLTPDNRGQIPAADLQALRGFRRIMDETFRKNFAVGATLVASNTRSNLTEFAAANCLDGRRDTCWSTDDGITMPELTLEFSQPTTFNLVSLREFLPLGQRIDAFALDEWQNGQWVEFARAPSIGNRRLLLVPDVTTTKVRLRITQASDSPALSEIGLFKVAK